LFEKITGNSWDAMNDLERDTEKKITEFDYENFIHPGMLKDVDTKSKEFKKYVR